MTTFSDPALLQREYYNPNTFDVYFTRDVSRDVYILNAQKPLGPMIAVCKADSHLYLPHGFYQLKGHGLPHGEPFDMLINLEEQMFKGNKVPSNVYGLNG